MADCYFNSMLPPSTVRSPIIFNWPQSPKPPLPEAVQVPPSVEQKYRVAEQARRDQAKAAGTQK